MEGSQILNEFVGFGDIQVHCYNKKIQLNTYL